MPTTTRCLPIGSSQSQSLTEAPFPKTLPSSVPTIYDLVDTVLAFCPFVCLFACLFICLLLFGLFGFCPLSSS